MGELIAITICQNGMSVLWVLVSPYDFGVHEDFSRGIRRRFVSFSIDALRMSKRVLFSKYVVGSRVVPA